MAYAQLLTGAYTIPTTLPTITQLNTAYTNALPNGNIVNIALINYASIKPDAVNNNLLYIANEQLFDVANRTTSPYETNTFFAATAKNNYAKYGSYSIYIPSTLYYTNTGLTITTIQVNFDDGNGFVPVPFNTIKSIAYNSIGTKKLVYKITFNNGTLQQCYNDVVVDNLPPTNTTGRYAAAFPFVNPTPDVPIPATTLHSGAGLIIRRSISNQGSNTIPKFLKPLIVVEGLDLGDAGDLFGTGYDYNDFWSEINANRTKFTNGNFTGAFDEQLDDIAGYDLIFVNFNNSLDNIERNAAMLNEVINFVNNNKLPGASQNVVMGISMGGLVSRYCLAQMVRQGQNPQTRLLITHDSPHRGANIPLGLQHLLQGIRGQKVKAFMGILSYRFDEIIPELLQVNKVLNDPSPTQQLLARVIDENGTIAFNTFLDGAYRTMVDLEANGITPPYKFIATSNGSQCGTPVLPPSSTLASMNGNGWFFIFKIKLWGTAKTDLKISALPNLGTSQNILDFTLKIRIKSTFFNLLKTAFTIQKNNPTNLLPLDGVAGGTRSLGEELPQTFTQPMSNSFIAWIPFIGTLGGGYTYNPSYFAPTFSFVPTTSALDIDNFNAVNLPYIFPKTGLNGSRAANYIAQEPTPANGTAGPLLINTYHTDFYSRTCNWLFNEMENFPNNISCTKADECLPITINITNTNCEGIKEVSVNNLNPLNPVTYTVTPSNSAILQPMPPNKVKVFALNNTPYTIIANYSYCGSASSISGIYNNNITATKSVEITDQTNTTVWCGGTNHTFTVNDFGERAIYNWNYNANFTLISASSNGQTITLQYNGNATAPENISCAVTSYCYQNNSGTITITYLGNLVTKQIKTTTTSFVPLQLNNNVTDNHAYVSFNQPGMSPQNLNYSLTSGFPDVWGSVANDRLQMFVYKKAGGATYTFNASLFNNTCNTTINVPFAITLNPGGGFSYQKIFVVAPNPVNTSTVVSVNQNAASNSFLNLCINAGAFIRIEVMTTFGLVLQTVNGAPFQQNVNVNIGFLQTGLYFFRISAIGCPNNGIYQEVQQVQKL